MSPDAPPGVDDRHSKADDLEIVRLITGAQQGDQEAFAGLYERYFDRVYGYLRVAIKDPHEAEDATQQVFISVYRALPSYKPERPFTAWLFRIARNQALDFHRASGRVAPEEPRDLERRRESVNDGDLRALRWTSDEDLWMLIERLPDAQREALVLRYVLDFSATEIAALLDRSPEAVRQLNRRALSFLRARLAALGREPAVHSAARTRRMRMTTGGRTGPLQPAQSFSLTR